MKQTFVSLMLVIISFLGIFDAGYVTLEVFSNRVPICRPPFQCATVLESKWAYIAGIPVSVYGLTFYTLMFILSVVNFLDLKVKLPVVGSVRKAQKWLATIGFMFSLYLITLMALVIKAWCLWCLVSAVSATILFVISRFLKTSRSIATAATSTEVQQE